VFGAEPVGFFRRRLVMSGGRAGPGGRTGILVGDKLAGELKLRPGSTLQVKKRPFTVTGIYHSGVFFEDTGAILDLATAQRLERRGSDVTTVAVQLAQDVKHSVAQRSLKRALPGTQILGTADDAERAGANGQLVRNVVTIIAALALIVGGLGVTNTMAMAVMERQRELALLSAVGWKRLRIASLVLAEGVATSVLGAGLGFLLGIIGADALNQALDVSSVVSPQITFETVWQALAIGVAIGILGGLYPAWRGTRGSAAELLGGA
jgi:putative ABC transport system permease protein